MVHMSKGNRYGSVRDDGRRVQMEMIYCQKRRVQLPKSQSSTFAFQKVTCHECLKILIEEFVYRASYCKERIAEFPYEKPAGFRYAKIQTGRTNHLAKIDPDILHRLGLGERYENT